MVKFRLMGNPDRKLNLIQIQTTSVCNGKCICCPYVNSWYAKNKHTMEDDVYKKIIDDIASYDNNFSGKFCPYLCNEPFADNKIIDRTQYAIDTLKHPYIEFSTNAELLNKNKIDNLYKMYENHNFYGTLIISHHGTDKDSVEKEMGINYEKTYKNIVDLVKRFDGQIDITIQDMFSSIDRKTYMNPMRQVKRYLYSILEDNDISKDKVNVSAKTFHNRAGNVKMEGWNYEPIVRKIGLRNPFDCIRIHGCLHIIYTGEVIGCCMDYFRETVIGDLRKTNVEEFFKSNTYKEWVDKVRGNIESPEDFICKRCQSPGG